MQGYHAPFHELIQIWHLKLLWQQLCHDLAEVTDLVIRAQQGWAVEFAYQVVVMNLYIKSLKILVTRPQDDNCVAKVCVQFAWLPFD